MKKIWKNVCSLFMGLSLVAMALFALVFFIGCLWLVSGHVNTR